MSSSTSSVPSSVPPPPPSSVTTLSEAPPTPTTPPLPSGTLVSSSTSLPPSTSELPSTSSTSTPPLPPTPSTTSTTSTPAPSPTFTPSSSPSTFLSVSNGNTIVVTTVIRSTPTSTAAVANSNTNKGFFDNTAAVAGTFSVVGLVGLGILIFIVTVVIRRRRAERFDKDVALAAAEAAATSQHPNFDDDYGYSSNGHGVGSYGYADTYHQDPVKFPPTREAYGMSDIGGTTYADPDNYSIGTGAGPGAAGIGAGTLYRSKSGKDQPDPFSAYAPHHDPTVSQRQASLRYRNPAQDRWDDPGLVRGSHDAAQNVPQPHPDNGVVRSKSLQSNNPAPSLSSHYSTDPLTQDPYAQLPPMPESYLDHYRTGFDPEKHQPQARPLSMASMTDAYSGVAPGNPLAQQPPVPEKPGNAGDLPNPFDNQTSGDPRLSGSSNYSDGPHPGFGHDDLRMSLRDDEDYGAGRRVLKVANE